MSLTRSEKERITDSRLKLQAVADSLHHIDPEKVPGYDAITHCLDEAERSLQGALHSNPRK